MKIARKFRTALMLLGGYLLIYGLLNFSGLYSEKIPDIHFDDSPTVSPYEYIVSEPFRDGRGIIYCLTRNPEVFVSYYVDLYQKKILGKIANFEALDISKNYDCLIGYPVKKTYQSKTISYFRDWLGGSIRSPRWDEIEYPLLKVPLKGQTQTLGKITKSPSYLFKASLSPDGRFYRMITTNNVQYIADLREQKIHPIAPSDSAQGGWWSNHEFLYRDAQSNVVTYDMETQSTQTLFTDHEILKLLADHKLLGPTHPLVSPIAIWNGTEYNFLLENKLRPANPLPDDPLQETYNWLLQIDKSNRSLRLLDTNFPFKYVGMWNHDLSLYVFANLEAGGMSAVHVMDTQTKEIKTVHPGSAEYPTANTQPVFCGDRIVFCNGKTIWMMDVNGENREQVFPPE